MKAGERLRCTCGESFDVLARAVRSPRVFRCGQCGAALPAEGRACAYCSAEITLEERGLSGVCPGCSARLSANARFCMECGIAIRPQRLTALKEGVACPRCRGTLRVREVGGASAIECASCAGLWISAAEFASFCERAEKQDLATNLERDASGATKPASSVVSGAVRGDSTARVPREGYIPCIACGELMQRRNFGGGSGIVIDQCKDHGVWLDHRELERALEFVRRGGLLRMREKEIARLAREAERRRESSGAPASPPPELGPWDQDGSPWSRRRGGFDATGELDLFTGLAWLAHSLARALRR